MVVIAVLIALGIFFMIFKLWQTSLMELGINAMTATIIGAIVIVLFIIVCYI